MTGNPRRLGKLHAGEPKKPRVDGFPEGNPERQVKFREKTCKIAAKDGILYIYRIYIYIYIFFFFDPLVHDSFPMKSLAGDCCVEMYTPKKTDLAPSFRPESTLRS